MMQHKLFVLCLLGALVARVDAAKIEVPKGTRVDFKAVPKEASAPLPAKMTTSAFAARLKEGGTFSLSGGDLVIAPPDFAKDNTFFLAVDTLELKNGARIVTNGNTVVIFANHVLSEDGGIVAFRDDERRAANGGQAEAGRPGVPGRLTSVHVIRDLTGILHVDLSGQNGGNGGPGTPGKNGSPGTKGDGAVSAALPVPPFCECKKGGGNGSPGGAGDTGSRGGDGGNGGSGGILELINIGTKPIPSTSLTFKADPGRPGVGGPGGAGGQGGPGGDGGDGGTCCNGGHPGPQGATGQSGAPGNPGVLPNAGQAIVKNLDLAFVVQHLHPNEK